MHLGGFNVNSPILISEIPDDFPNSCKWIILFFAFEKRLKIIYYFAHQNYTNKCDGRMSLTIIVPFRRECVALYSTSFLCSRKKTLQSRCDIIPVGNCRCRCRLTHSLTHSHTVSLSLFRLLTRSLLFSRKDHVVNSDLVVSPAHRFSFPSTHLPGTNYFVQSEQNNDNF